MSLIYYKVHWTTHWYFGNFMDLGLIERNKNPPVSDTLAEMSASLSGQRALVLFVAKGLSYIRYNKPFFFNRKKLNSYSYFNQMVISSRWKYTSTTGDVMPVVIGIMLVFMGWIGSQICNSAYIILILYHSWVCVIVPKVDRF